MKIAVELFGRVIGVRMGLIAFRLQDDTPPDAERVCTGGAETEIAGEVPLSRPFGFAADIRAE